MRPPAVSHIDVIKSSTTSLEESKFPLSRVELLQQQSTRRSKFSGELGRDTMANLPSTRLSTPAAPLNPVTPLRWKSSKRLELEKKKLQEETRAKEVQAKKPGAKDVEKKDPRLSKLSTKPDQKAEKDGDLQFHSSPNGDLKLQSSPNGRSTETHMREETEASADRKSANAGDESSIVTIDSLRARLLAERANSKAAKERVQQLTKKVLELEARLDHEIQARKKAEESAQEALLKCESLGKQALLSKEGPHVITSKLLNPATPETTGKTTNERVDHELSEPAQVHGADPIKAAVAATNLECGDALPVPENVPSEENLTSDQKHGIQSVDDAVSSVESPSIDSGLQQQKRRFSGEERLRRMWDQMTEEMAALAEDKAQDQEHVMDWMGQVPRVLHGIILPKPISEDEKLAADSSTRNIQLKDADVVPDLDHVQNPGTAEALPLKAASSGSKKVASLIERFEAQESGQRELEHKQNSIGRRRSIENPTIPTNKTSGTPPSPELQPEQAADPTPPKLVEDPRHNSHPTNASVSGKTTIRKENKKVDPQTPKITIPMVRMVEQEGIIPPCAKTEDFLKDAESGSERSLVAPFMTPPHGKKQSNHDLSSAYEDAQTPTGRDSASQWDVGLQLVQHETLGSFNSQAGNSNAYIRPEVPGSYPLRDDEREIYRGRMESVSRSMEGLGHSYMSDPEGDEDIMLESGSTRLQMPFQVPGGSGRSNGYQGESLVCTPQSFTIPGREFPIRPPAKHDSSTTKVNEVLKALQLAKLSIQKTGARRTSISNTCYSTSDHSAYSSGERRQNLKTEYGFDGMSNRSPVAIRVWSHQELSRRYSTGGFREAGSPPRLQYNSTSPASLGKYPEPEDRPLAGRSSPVGSNNARRKFVDKISSGGGIQYFYPT